jgi:hypothetical protein
MLKEFARQWSRWCDRWEAIGEDDIDAVAWWRRWLEGEIGP